MMKDRKLDLLPGLEMGMKCSLREREGYKHVLKGLGWWWM